MTSYYVGDTPRDPLTIGVPTGWDDATIYLDGLALPTELSGSTATATWTADPFATTGIYPVSVVVTKAGGARQTLTTDSLVVEEADGWHTLASSRAEWTNALNDVQLFTLLTVARVAVESFRPLDDDAVPLRYRQAQLMQARNVLNASKTDPAQGADGELFVIRPYPLDLFIRELIQPRSVVPAVG